MTAIGLCGWDSRALYSAGIKTRDKLALYSEIYSTVEINSTFYSFPSVKSVEDWYLTVPPDFRFSVKLNRLFSHDSPLGPNEATRTRLPEFLASTAPLYEKLAWYLLQLPPSLAADESGLEYFLGYLRVLLERLGSQAKVAVEFRHSSWYTEETYAILKEHDATQVISSSPNKWPCIWVEQPDANYIRLHGLREMYRSAYTTAELEKLADWIRHSPARESWVYFDNGATLAGKENSQALMALFGQAVPQKTEQLRMDLPD